MDTILIFTGLIFGSIGTGYIVYGRKQANIMAILAGVGLCVFFHIAYMTLDIL